MDKALLLANKFSNNYGTNWGKGFLFTLLSGFITYSIILFTEDKVNNIISILLIYALFFVIMDKAENVNFSLFFSVVYMLPFFVFVALLLL